MKKIDFEKINENSIKNLKNISDTLRAERNRRKLSINDVCIDIGIGHNTVVNIENYKSINLINLLDYCNYLGITVELKGGK